eukprot:CAMPEP_0114275422 /NCGR_PEP_ID=MMETSP0058-20121206/30322_1 /TAXON_ID=36894 /ORGANISM="Pyramimonas parkeae, CCMP726" /LENGTH=808 /DNA_ID=CAMNT_0001395343 /DNA_START=29 /DNA_END=2456 /DNA_ORIENTATION=+
MRSGTMAELSSSSRSEILAHGGSENTPSAAKPTFMGLAIALVVLACEHSEYTTLLSNIYSQSEGTYSLFENPDVVLLLVGAVLLVVAGQGITGLCFNSKRLLLIYNFAVLALLTILIYVAGMMFIYREDARSMMHTYWERLNNEFSILHEEHEYIPIMTVEEQDYQADKVRAEMMRAGSIVCAIGALLLVALICSTEVMGWKYGLRRIGSFSNFCGIVFGLSLLSLAYIVATDSYYVPDALTAHMSVKFQRTADDVSISALNFQETLLTNPEVMFQTPASSLFPVTHAPTTFAPTQASSSPTTPAPTETDSPTSLAPTPEPSASPTDVLPDVSATSSPTEPSSTSPTTPATASPTKALTESPTGGSRRMLLADAPTPTAAPAVPIGPVPNTLEVGWRWPASAVWVQRVRRADPLPTLEVVSFSISFAGLNATTLMHPSDTVGVNKSFTQQLGAQVAQAAMVSERAVTTSRLETGGRHPIAGAWAAHLLAASGAISAVISLAGMIGTISESRAALACHCASTAMVIIMLTIATGLAISNADDSQKMVHHNWHIIQQDVVGSRLTISEATQLVDNNMRLIGVLGAACLMLLLVSGTCSALLLFVLPPLKRKRLATNKDFDGSDPSDDEAEEQTLLPGRRSRRRTRNKAGTATDGPSATDKVVLEMQSLHNLLERTERKKDSEPSSENKGGPALNAAPSSIDPKEKGKRYKKYYGSDDSEELSTDPEECMPEVIARKMHERAARRAQRAVSQGKVKGKGHTSTSARGESAQASKLNDIVSGLAESFVGDSPEPTKAMRHAHESSKFTIDDE